MNAYWSGFVAGVGTAVGVYLVLLALSLAWFVREARRRDGVEPHLPEESGVG